MSGPLHLGLSLLTLVPGRMGGSESYVRALLEQFIEGNGPERVTVLANRDVMSEYAEYDRGPVSLHAVPAYRPGRRAAARAAAMLAAHALPGRLSKRMPGGLDLVHYPVTVPIPATRLPRVLTLHDVQHHDLPEFFSPPERSLRRLTYDRAAQRASVVITPSEYSAARIAAVLGIARDRIQVVPSGVDHGRFRPSAQAEDVNRRAQLGLLRPYVLYPANLWPHKNHARLVEAFGRIPGSELELVLLGRTYDRLGAVQDVADRTGVGKRVRHLGYVDRDSVPALYRGARALVFPSLYEGFGGPPLEAMACGCPVASSTRASLSEIVEGACVELDPESVDSIAAAIERVTTDEDLCSQLIEKGLERAKRFSWQESAERHVAAYARALYLTSPRPNSPRTSSRSAGSSTSL